jgi:hypothetical protein
LWTAASLLAKTSSGKCIPIGQLGLGNCFRTHREIYKLSGHSCGNRRRWTFVQLIVSRPVRVVDFVTVVRIEMNSPTAKRLATL